MIQVRIYRMDATPSNGTLGALLIDGNLECFSLEPYHRSNMKNISSIPTGQYICKPVKSQKYGDTWEVTGVAGRSGILFHRGNTDEDTRGCILLGRGVDGGKITDSKKAFDKFSKKINGKMFRLTVSDCY